MYLTCSGKLGLHYYNKDLIALFTVWFCDVSIFKFNQYPQHMYICDEEINTIYTIYVNQAVWYYFSNLCSTL